MSGQLNVVFGAGGALGTALVRKLAADGLPVRAVARDAAKVRHLLPGGVELVAADARIPGGVRQACSDARLIYHAINVPYHLWDPIMPEVTENILAAAKERRAGIVFAGNVYGYGHFHKIPAPEDHPRDATTKKGKLRNELERRLMEAHQAGSVRVVIPRMTDFYGPNVTNKYYGAMFEAALADKRTMWMANPDVPHDLLFIEDAAAACVLLANTETAYGETWHVPGAGPLTGREFLRMVYDAAGTRMRMTVINRFLLWMASLTNSAMKEVTEILYLFEEPQVLDGSKFQRAFPSFRYTPHHEAVRRTVEWFRERA